MSYNIVNSDGSITKIAGVGAKGKDGTNTQYAELPENPTDGMLIQYVGTSTETFTYGYFYRYNLSTDEWVQTNIQSGGTFDDRPTAGSKNPVTSEGIKAAIDEAIGFAVDEILSSGY